MDKKNKTQPCPECGGAMRFEEHEDVLDYKGHTCRIQTLGWWCSHCGEAILSGAPLLAHERAFQQLKAQVDEVMGPDEVMRVRKKLGLSQRKAGEILGGGARAFQKYESGQQAVSLPMSNLLRLLGNDPARVAEIEAAKVASKRRGTTSKPPKPGEGPTRARH